MLREEKAEHARIEPSRERKGEAAVMVDGCHGSGEVWRACLRFAPPQVLIEPGTQRFEPGKEIITSNFCKCPSVLHFVCILSYLQMIQYANHNAEPKQYPNSLRDCRIGSTLALQLISIPSLCLYYSSVETT